MSDLIVNKTVYSDGQWNTGGGCLLESKNPNSLETLWMAPQASKDDVDSAVKSARKSFKTWTRLTLEERQAYIEKFAQKLAESKEKLADLIGLETGKPLWEATTEVAGMIAKVNISVQAYLERTGTKEQDVAAGHAVLRHRAHGVLAIFGPYNFPGHLPNGHIVPALLAGNTLVFKPSEQTPAVGEAVVKLWQEAGLPDGVINLVQGGKETGQALANHSQIDGIMFTGSSNTGVSLHKQFAGQPDKILALEMGGNNPLLVFPPFDLKGAIHHTIFSAYVSAGQRCTCARRLIVPATSEGDQFVEQLIKSIEQIQVGTYNAEPQPFMGSVISPEAKAKIIQDQQSLIEAGAKVLVRLKAVDDQSSLLTPGLLDVSEVKELPDEEVFGPLLQVQRCRDFDHGLELANATRYGLAAGLVSHDKVLYERFLLEVRAGVVNWNKPLTGASSAAPFGGVGISGNHRPSAYYAADYCAYPVASLESDTIQLPGALSPGLSI